MAGLTSSHCNMLHSDLCDAMANLNCGDENLALDQLEEIRAQLEIASEDFRNG